MSPSRPRARSAVATDQLEAVSRFVGNVGVPATIALFILYQITPRLDRIADGQSIAGAQLTLIAASCSRPVLDVSPGTFQVVPGG